MPLSEHTKVVLDGLIRPNEGALSVEARRFDAVPMGPKELIEDLAAHWVRYIECHKCGWFSHCQYPQRFPGQPHRARDIQCGVALRALTNFVQSWWSAFVQMDVAQKQHFLDALFWWTEYVSEAVFSLGRISDVDHLTWCGPELAALTMTSPNVSDDRSINFRSTLRGPASLFLRKPLRSLRVNPRQRFSKP